MYQEARQLWQVLAKNLGKMPQVQKFYFIFSIEDSTIHNIFPL